MFRIFSKKINLQHGFTLVELIVAIVIFAILCSIAIPAYSSWLPEYRLKNAVRDLYSNMQLTKMLSVKKNANYKIVFDTTGGGTYRIIKPSGEIEKKLDFLEYDKGGGIRYGKGKAKKSAKESGPPKPVPDDGVSYPYNQISFDPKGIGSGMGYVYLENDKGTAYAVGSWASGIIVLKKWNESSGEWE